MAFDEMLRTATSEAAEKGRFGDKHLLHISDDELRALMAAGVITVNPETGLPEAFNLGSALGSAVAGPMGMVSSFLSPKEPPQVPALEDLARSTSSQANLLIPSVSTGELPPGASAQVNNAVSDAINSIKSKYASMGMSGSTVEAQEISQAQARGQAMAFQMADELTKTGLTEAGISANIYESIMKAQLEQDAALQNALASFAGAFAFGQGMRPSPAAGGAAAGGGAAGGGLAAAPELAPDLAELLAAVA